MLNKQNCWEHKQCGRQAGGYNAGSGVCPAATASGDGWNNGCKGGRICWAITGTFCGGLVQGNYAEKRLSCMKCDFYNTVRLEQGNNFAISWNGITQWNHKDQRRLKRYCELYY